MFMDTVALASLFDNSMAADLVRLFNTAAVLAFVGMAVVLEFVGMAVVLELVGMAAAITHNPLVFIKAVANHMVAVNPSLLVAVLTFLA